MRRSACPTVGRRERRSTHIYLPNPPGWDRLTLYGFNPNLNPNPDPTANPFSQSADRIAWPILCAGPRLVEYPVVTESHSALAWYLASPTRALGGRVAGGG